MLQNITHNQITTRFYTAPNSLWCIPILNERTCVYHVQRSLKKLFFTSVLCNLEHHSVDSYICIWFNNLRKWQLEFLLPLISILIVEGKPNVTAFLYHTKLSHFHVHHCYENKTKNHLFKKKPLLLTVSENIILQN